MQRVHRRRHQIYEDKDFQIQSINSLVKSARQKTCENLCEDPSDIRSIKLPLHQFTERIRESLEQMHHHLQTLLMQKLGPDARNVIAAERARQNQADKERLDKAIRKNGQRQERRDADYIAQNLSEVGQDSKDELELLNEYRERYAWSLAELLVARDRLIDVERTMQEETADRRLSRTLSEDIAQLSGDENERKGMKTRHQRRRRSHVSSGGFSSDESQIPDTPNIGWKRWN